MEINLEINQPAEAKKSQDKKKNNDGRVYATGKRKTSIARVWLKKGSGNIIVNKKSFDKYFSDESASTIANQPFDITNTLKQYDIYSTVTGGGSSGQVQALRHAISKALVKLNETAFRVLLRQSGLLTRDSRTVERKKYGRKKARKSFQFSKR
jgi:small subunit ribosomal protein S9